MSDDDANTTDERRLVLNPESGDGSHAERARQLAAEYRFRVVETERSGDGVELAKQAAADGVGLLAVCGGDGTVHEVVGGIVAADALDAVTLCIVPAGTANFSAAQLGIGDLAEGFEVAAHGERRRLDLGIANGEPFLLSAVAGLPAEASGDASSGLKKRLGTFAFVVEGAKSALKYDAPVIEVDVVAGGEEVAWTGEALAVLIGNLRRFTKEGGQANAEDGLFEVAIVERMPAGDAVAEAVEQRLLNRDTPHVTELAASRVEVVSVEEEPVTFSLDGEIRTDDDMRFSVLPRALQVRVGEDYAPTPEAGRS